MILKLLDFNSVICVDRFNVVIGGKFECDGGGIFEVMRIEGNKIGVWGRFLYVVFVGFLLVVVIFISSGVNYEVEEEGLLVFVLSFDIWGI